MENILFVRHHSCSESVHDDRVSSSDKSWGGGGGGGSAINEWEYLAHKVP